jgi:hypothetical protein
MTKLRWHALYTSYQGHQCTLHIEWIQLLTLLEFLFSLLEILVKKNPFWIGVKKPPSHFGQVVLNMSIVTRPCTLTKPKLALLTNHFNWYFWLVILTSQYNNKVIFWLGKHHFDYINGMWHSNNGHPS